MWAVGFLALASLAAANPIQKEPRSLSDLLERTEGGSIDLPIYSRQAKRDLSPEENLSMWADRVAAIKNKYGIQGSSSARKEKRATGSTYLAGNQQSYYTSIQLGTPPVTLEVVLDTGSSDLVILTEATREACGGTCTITAPLYSASASSTSQTTTDPVSITYGTGSADGFRVSDVMSMAGFNGTQIFAACDNASALVTSSDQSGLLGLGWGSIAESKATPFVQDLWQTGQLSQPSFAFGLAQLDANDVPNPNLVVPGGVLTIGGTNSSLYTGSLNWVSLSDSGTYWDIPLQGVSVNGQDLGMNDPAAIIDTGTNAIAVSSDIAANFYASVPNSQLIEESSGIYAYPCSQQVTLSLTFGGQSYSMLPKDFNGGTVNRAGTLCAGQLVSLGSTGDGAPNWIVGTPFLMSFYNAYRFEPPAVGFATMTTSASSLKGPIPSSGGRSSSGSSGGASSGSSSGSTPQPSAAPGSSGSGPISTAAKGTQAAVATLLLGVAALMGSFLI